jgi:site-specific DNA recombinase
MRAALYARYSNERQNERSADDQLAACRAHALAQGWNVVVEFKDEAISGALMVNRPAINALMAMADAGGFDVLLTEDEDRIARNLEHQAHVYNRLQAAGIRWATLYTGEVELMHVAFKGMMAQQYLVDLSRKTRRGVLANAVAGKATGGRLFGYKSEPGGAVSIVEAEAEVVREIFARYVSGETAKAIAADLNARGIRGARGGKWSTAQISGSRQRANGVLQTELYAGVKVYGRMDVRKDPATGKRRPVMKPESEWKRTPVPHLAIVEADAWRAVQVRKRLNGSDSVPRHLSGRRATGIFSGLLRCVCGANYSAIAKDRLGCSAHANQGPSVCANNRTVSRRQVEQRLLHALEANMLEPAAIQLYVEAYHARWAERRKDRVRSEGGLRTRLGEAQRRIERLLDAIEEGAATEETKPRLVAAAAERDRLKAELERLDEAEPPIELHPAAAVRDLVEKVVIRPKGRFDATPYDLELHGRLGPLLQGATNPTHCRVGMVAGGGYSLDPTRGPQTFRLVA